MQRLVAEWLAERARLVGSLIGLTDEQFKVAKHVLGVEQDSLKTMGADRVARGSISS